MRARARDGHARGSPALGRGGGRTGARRRRPRRPAAGGTGANGGGPGARARRTCPRRDLAAALGQQRDGRVRGRRGRHDWRLGGDAGPTDGEWRRRRRGGERRRAQASDRVWRRASPPERRCRPVRTPSCRSSSRRRSRPTGRRVRGAATRPDRFRPQSSSTTWSSPAGRSGAAGATSRADRSSSRRACAWGLRASPWRPAPVSPRCRSGAGHASRSSRPAMRCARRESRSAPPAFPTRTGPDCGRSLPQPAASRSSSGSRATSCRTSGLAWSAASARPTS